MLVLSRKNDESIMIGDDVKITVVEIRGDKVRAWHRCPKEMPVHHASKFSGRSNENEGGIMKIEMNPSRT